MSGSYRSNLKDTVGRLRSARADSLREIGETMADKVARAAPVDTGELMNSVGSEIVDDGVMVGAEAEHSKYVELGTSRTPANPFLEPTIRESTSELLSIINENMSKM